jgi:hypothetical protein
MTQEQLLAPYMQSGKDSGYQPLPNCMAERLSFDVPVSPRWSADHGRLDGLKAHFDFRAQRPLGFGAHGALVQADTCNRPGSESGLSEFYLRPLCKLV